MEATIKELKKQLFETKSIYESCLADLNEKDQIMALKTVISTTNCSVFELLNFFLKENCSDIEAKLLSLEKMIYELKRKLSENEESHRCFVIETAEVKDKLIEENIVSFIEF